MRPYYLHRKQHLHENKNESKVCSKCFQLPTGGFRCFVGHQSDDDESPDGEELGFSTGDDLGRCSPKMVVLCAMIDEILEVLNHAAYNLDNTLAKYVLAQYLAELKKTEDRLLKDEEEAEIASVLDDLKPSDDLVALQKAFDTFGDEDKKENIDHKP